MKLFTATFTGLWILTLGLVLGADHNPPTAVSPHGTVESQPPSPRHVAAQVMESVVVITAVTYQHSASPAGPGHRSGPNRVRDRSEVESISGGTGVVITSNGHILTNHHVIEDADEVLVTLADNSRHKAEVVGIDSPSDLAVLKIDAGNLQPAEFGDSSQLAIGQWVLAVGNPLGLERTVTLGIISATGRCDLGVNDYEDFIQTDASVNSGNSGGPLFALGGQVVGINTVIMSPSGGSVGLNFAISSNLARFVAQNIIQTGCVNRGYLGAVLASGRSQLSAPDAEYQPVGARVDNVMAASPAQRAGLRRGDVVTSVNGIPVQSSGELRCRIAMTSPESEVVIGILRNDEPILVTVRLGTTPGARPARGTAGL